MDQLESARENYSKALATGIHEIWIWSDCAWLHHRLGAYDQELEYLQKAQEMGRDDDWLHYRKADAYSQLDRYDEALSELDIAE